MRQINSVLVACFLLLLSLTLLHAQVNTATIFGRVVDDSAAAVPGADVKVTNEGTGSVKSTVANDRGEFTLPFLEVGTYTISIQLPGFKAHQTTGLKLSAAERVNLTFALQVGEIADQVTVTGEAPLLENTTSQLNVRLDARQVTELPLLRRNLANILNLAPGVMFGGKYGDTYAVNGLPPASHTINLDGSDASRQGEQNSISGKFGYQLIHGTTLEAVEEVKIAKNTMSAEIGATFSGNVNIITKSGSNNLHGSLVYNYMSAGLNARPRLARSKLPLIFHQFGGSVGGPVVRDKLFFFSAYEGYRQKEAALINGLVPTQALRDKAIAAQPSYRAFFEHWPLPTEPPKSPTDFGATYIGDGPRTHKENYFLFRGDYHVGERGILTARFAHSAPERLQPRLPVQLDQSGISRQYYGAYIHGAPTWTSEARISFNDNDPSVHYQQFALGKSAYVSVAPTALGFSLFTEDIFNTGQIFTAEEVMAFQKKGHSLKIGGSFGYRQTSESDIYTTQYNYSTEEQFLANSPNSVSPIFGKKPFGLYRYAAGLFVQDDVRVSPRLMVNLGVRYDNWFVPKEKDGKFFNYDGIYSTVLRPPDSAVEADRNNFSPRLGFAWQIDQAGKTVLRGGAGVFYTAVPNITYQFLVRNSLYEPSVLDLSPAEVARYGLKFPMGPDEIRNLGVLPTTGRATTNQVDPHHRDPYAMAWNLSIQRQLTETMAFEVGYVGNGARKITLMDGENKLHRESGLRPHPELSGFRLFDDVESTHYHGFQTSLVKRFSKDLSFNAHYTWSNNMCYASGDLFRGDRVQQNSAIDASRNQMWLERAPTPHNLPHKFTVDHIYTLPFGRLARTQGMRKLLEGWQVTGIVTVQSGINIELTQTGQIGAQRPDFVCSSRAEAYSNVPAGKHVNPNCFALVPLHPVSKITERPGTLGRNAFRLPRVSSYDASFSKTTRLNETVGLQLRADFQNLFNGFYYTAVRGSLGSGTSRQGNFADYSATSLSRQLQFNVRLTF